MSKPQEHDEPGDEQLCGVVADSLTAQLNGMQQKFVLTVLLDMVLNIFLHLRDKNEKVPDPQDVLAEYDRWASYARSMLTEAIKLTRMQ